MIQPPLKKGKVNAMQQKEGNKRPHKQNKERESSGQQLCAILSSLCPRTQEGW